jgi:glycosyltransferase involved in cell wall biosynthesis
VTFVECTTEVEAYLQAADVFVLPSSREGLSNALLEAMSTGLPSIAVAPPGEAHAVIESGVNGYAVRPGDPAALAGVLDELLRNDRLRADMGRSARRTILERFAITTVADRYFGLYSELTRPTL